MTKPSRKNVLILGMPRSGTSLTASMFARAGYYTGRRLRAPAEGNPLGYFQSEEMGTLNEQLFHQVGFPFHNTWTHERISEETLDQIDELTAPAEHRRFVLEFDSRAPWMLKDPRLCMTLSFWWKLFDARTIRVLLVRRDKAAIYHSFKVQNFVRNNALTRQEVYYRIDQHINRVLKTVDRYRIPCLEIRYEELCAAPDAVVASINAFAHAAIRPEHVQIHRELDHSLLRNRVAWPLITLSRRSPAVRRLVKSLMPKPLIYLLFPERRHLEPDAKQRTRILNSCDHA